MSFFFCARRRRRADAVVSELQPKRAGRKWTRHLRAFAFDAELLTGGRFSSANSMGSPDHSICSDAASRTPAHSAEPSLRSADEVDPLYRAAVSHVHPPGPMQNRSVPTIAMIAPDRMPQPLSTTIAPPSYHSTVGETVSLPATPTSATNPLTN